MIGVNKWIISDSSSAAASLAPVATINIFNFPSWAGKILVLQQFNYATLYDLAASAGQFIYTASVCSVTGLSTGSRFSRNASLVGGAAIPLYFHDRIQYKDLNLVMGEVATTAAIVLTCTCTTPAAVAPAGVNNSYIRFYLGFDLVDKKYAKDLHDL